jgi:hypothetical protein
VTFFITRPPFFRIVPVPSTKRTPIRLSRQAPGLDAPGPRDIGSHDAADGRHAVGPEKRAVIHRLERQALVFLGQKGLDLASGVPARATIVSAPGS